MLSAKGEREGLRAWIEKLNLECSIFNRTLLANELVETVLCDRAVPL